MSNIKFIYMYRDGANYKSWGEIIFTNLDNLSLQEVARRLDCAFESGEFFIASQISIPEKFLFLNGEYTTYDHCYHVLDSLEICEESPTDSLGRSISEFLRDVEAIAQQGWRVFDILEHRLLD